ncbi:MAG: SPOR domain-containing protein [Gemmatimonadetes bacterium]|nr:SPOR domain-containing protein [Gemmatimonadota bacterium]
MRRSLIFSIALLACHGADQAVRPGGPGGNGPDAILLRIPREGGVARAYRWGSDSAIWQSGSRVPSVNRLLAFDDAQGSVAYVDAKGIPGRLDVRVGQTTPASEKPLGGLTSADGWALYGVGAKHEVQRLTPSGTWNYTPEAPPRSLIPLPDGTLVLLSDDGNRSVLRRLRPPEPRVTQTTQVPHAQLVVRTDIGDRLYFAGDSGLVTVRTRDLTRMKTIRLGSTVVDAAATPSGDRIFVALQDDRSVTVIDRYAEAVDRTIKLPTPPAALRMDPDGQFVLARSPEGDSVRIIAVGTARYVGSVSSAWRADLPQVAPDGGLVVAQGNDVVIVDAMTRRERVRYAGGATDLWMLVRWNGFRPRAAGLDEPVKFETDSTDVPAVADSTQPAGAAAALPPNAVAAATQAVAAPSAAVASAAAAGTAGATGAATATIRPTAPGAPAASAATPVAPAPTASAVAKKPFFTLSFAALLNEERAKLMAATIKVEGKPVRVVPGLRDGTPVYRIVFGPFDSRAEAERLGKKSGLPFWVFEGTP